MGSTAHTVSAALVPNDGTGRGLLEVDGCQVQRREVLPLLLLTMQVGMMCMGLCLVSALALALPEPISTLSMGAASSAASTGSSAAVHLRAIHVQSKRDQREGQVPGAAPLARSSNSLKKPALDLVGGGTARPLFRSAPRTAAVCP